MRSILIIFFIMIAWPVAFSSVLTTSNKNVKTGLDVLMSQDFQPLIGKRIGLVTNQTGLSRNKQHIIDVLAHDSRFKLTKLFSPEHGIRGTEDDVVSSSIDKKTGLPVYSLYGKHRKPTANMLADVDVIVFDLQDVGVRYYTYISTLALVMKSAKENNKLLIVLDRPNMIGGAQVEGPLLDKNQIGKFTSYYPLPTRYGMTMGELARLYNDYFKIHCHLHVIPMKNWHRSMYYDETGLAWVNPSPNLKNLEAVIHYAGLGALEASSLSVGRGTAYPFLRYGAPWIEEVKFTKILNSHHLPGIYFKPTQFVPHVVKGMPIYPYVNQVCHGFEPIILDRKEYQPITTSIHIMAVLDQLYPDKAKINNAASMLGERQITVKLKQGNSIDDITGQWKHIDFMKARKRALLYN